MFLSTSLSMRLRVTRLRRSCIFFDSCVIENIEERLVVTKNTYLCLQIKYPAAKDDEGGKGIINSAVNNRRIFLGPRNYAA